MRLVLCLAGPGSLPVRLDRTSDSEAEAAMMDTNISPYSAPIGTPARLNAGASLAFPFKFGLDRRRTFHTNSPSHGNHQ